MMMRTLLAATFAIGMVTAVSAQRQDPLPRCYPCKAKVAAVSTVQHQDPLPRCYPCKAKVAAVSTVQHQDPLPRCYPCKVK